MDLKTRILCLLLEERYTPRSIREIAQTLKADYKNTYNAVMALKDSLHLRKVGASYQITTNNKLTPDLFTAEAERTKSIQLKTLVQDIKDIQDPFFIAIIFGSHAKKQATKKSDVDLCIITNTPTLSETILKKTQIFPFPVEIHSFTTKQFISMMQSTQPSVAREIAQHGVIVRNTEAYYDLIR